MLRAEEPDVVTLDLGLPPDPDGTSEGFAVLETVLKLKPDTKVIVASGHGARESALQAIAMGAYDFYQKPIDIDELGLRSEEHTSELQSLMRISYAVFCLKKKIKKHPNKYHNNREQLIK